MAKTSRSGVSQLTQWFTTRNILSVGDFKARDLETIFEVADSLEPINLGRTSSDLMKGLVLGTLFFEPSTRTRLSFETAMLRLGGNVINVIGNSSSLEKGESLRDMGRVVSCFADVIAMRHPTAFTVHELSEGSTVPVINAGDGANEHPTQAMLDLYTIRKNQRRLKGLKVGLLGDLKYGRAAHSLIRVLALYGTEFVLISHPSLKLPEELLRELKTLGCNAVETSDLRSAIQDLDVLYVTRVQKERFPNLVDYEQVKNEYRVDLKTLRGARRSLSILHPLPRLDEIASEVDADPRFGCFDQVANGVTIRMALLALVAGRIPKAPKGKKKK
ncbi:MAG: aspartate carbamoyltransferase [Oligoflexia bacterium]|nr:aspartate carbamoyltransferase [Oligoflexia bacterium]